MDMHKKDLRRNRRTGEKSLSEEKLLPGERFFSEWEFLFIYNRDKHI